MNNLNLYMRLRGQIKKVSNAKGHWALAGYVIGGAAGSVLSAWITKTVYGE